MYRKEKLLNRRTVVKGFFYGALAGLGAVSSALGPFWILPEAYGNKTGCDGPVPLRLQAAKKGLIYGAETTFREIGDAEFVGAFKRECGILVPGDELKWKALRPTPGSFDFSRADFLARFAKGSNMHFRGHTLVWHEALPWWFGQTVNSGNAERILREHIETVVGHYAGQIHSWDVVNEAIATWEKDSLPNGLRNSPWLKLLGPKYIDIAFRTAADADPEALMALNQNVLEYGSKASEQCRADTLDLLRRLKSSGTPIHALGIQGHIRTDYEHAGRFSPGKFRRFLRDVADLDLKILISELDVVDSGLPRDIALHDRAVAGIYKEFLDVALAEPAVIGVITWGLSDRYSWQRYGPGRDKTTVRPLPLDVDLNRKPAWYAISNAFDNAHKNNF